jgi:hypothetical protein
MGQYLIPLPNTLHKVLDQYKQTMLKNAFCIMNNISI